MFVILSFKKWQYNIIKYKLIISIIESIEMSVQEPSQNHHKLFKLVVTVSISKNVIQLSSVFKLTVNICDSVYDVETITMQMTF